MCTQFLFFYGSKKITIFFLIWLFYNTKTKQWIFIDFNTGGNIIFTNIGLLHPSCRQCRKKILAFEATFIYSMPLLKASRQLFSAHLYLTKNCTTIIAFGHYLLVFFSKEKEGIKLFTDKRKSFWYYEKVGKSYGRKIEKM